MSISKSLFHLPLVAAIALMVAPETASAASCKASVRGPSVRAGSESTAQWFAIVRWERKVRRLHGTAYDDWDNAKGARFFCRESALGGSEFCEAVGRPCKD